LQLSTLERLEPALALYLIIAWRIQYLTLLGRATPDLPCDAVLDPANASRLRRDSPRPPRDSAAAARHAPWIARWAATWGASTMDRRSKALWIGLQRARDLAWGMQLASEIHSQSTVRDVCNGQGLGVWGSTEQGTHLRQFSLSLGYQIF